MDTKEVLQFITDKIVPDNLIIDDDTLDNVLYEREINRVVIADVYQNWLNNGFVHDSYIAALAAILIHDPDPVKTEDNKVGLEFLAKALHDIEETFNPADSCNIDDLLTFANLLFINKRYCDVEKWYSKAWEESKKQYGIAHEIRIGILENLICLMKTVNNIDKELVYKGLCEKEKKCISLLHSGQLDDYRSLRTEALNLIKQKNYKDSQEIYRWLLIKRFEVAGLHCHLARLYAYTDELDESKKHLDIGWRKREFATKYVVPRILFLQILIAIIEGRDFSNYIKEFIKAICQPGAFCEWTILPLIEKYNAKISHEYFDFVFHLGSILNLPDPSSSFEYQIRLNKIYDLNRFPFWNEVFTRMF